LAARGRQCRCQHKMKHEKKAARENVSGPTVKGHGSMKKNMGLHWISWRVRRSWGREEECSDERHADAVPRGNQRGPGTTEKQDARDARKGWENIEVFQFIRPGRTPPEAAEPGSGRAGRAHRPL